MIDSLKQLAESDDLRWMTDDQIEKLVDAQDTDLDSELRRLRQQYRQQDEEFVALTRLRTQNELTEEEFRAQAEPIRTLKSRLMDQITELGTQREARDLRQRNASQVRDAIIAFPELWDNLDDDERRRLLQLTLEKLVLVGPSDKAVLRIRVWQMPEQEVYLPNVRSVGSRGRNGVDGLTIREMELLDLRQQGLTVAQIANRWDIPRESLHTTQSVLLRRLGVATVGAAFEAAKERIEVHRGVLHRKPRLRRKDGRSDRWRPTERQLQIIRNRLDGMDARHNADALGVKRGTIHAVVDQMKRRAGVRSFDELVEKVV